MRYLVTGGAGFIGSNMVDELVRRGHRVTGTVAGLLLIAWLVVEVAVIQEFSWLQVAFVAVGVAVLLLAVPTPTRGKPAAWSGRMKEMP